MMATTKYLKLSLPILMLTFLIVSPLTIPPVVSELSPDQCENVKDYRFYDSYFGTGDPYGDAAVIVTVCKIRESDPNHDWYFYYIRFQTVPGAVAYRSSWETAHEYLYHKVFLSGTYRWLWDYDPTSTSAYDGAVVTVGINVDAQSAGFSYSESYTIRWLIIIDKSNFNTNEANWEADFNEQNDPGGYNGPSTSTVLLKYAFIVETLPGQCSFVDGKYGVMWGKPVLWWWDYKTLWGNTAYLDLCPSWGL